MDLSQTEIRLRIRAAMGLAGIGSWEGLAAKTGYSRSLLKDLGTPRGTAERKHLMAIAGACEVPFEWFTLPSLSEAIQVYAAEHPSDVAAATRFAELASEAGEPPSEPGESLPEADDDEGAADEGR